MKLSKHIGYKLLTDENLAMQIVAKVYPEITKKVLANGKEGLDTKDKAKVATFYDMVNNVGSRNYFITETVIEKLDMLKVKKKVVNGLNCYDYTVFSKIKNGKLTFIMPENNLLRVFIENKYICFGWFSLRPAEETDEENAVALGGTAEGRLAWSFFWANRFTGEPCPIHDTDVIQGIETTVYKLLCFFYLSENEEIILQPKEKKGTKKSGKFINELPFPITIVSSKWNVTSVRTEGFPVSGHFRLQRVGSERSETKMIFIEPFQKHGYIRHAKKESVSK